MLWAFAGFSVYGLIAWFTKNLYPFSAYSMYATSAKMRRSHVPSFWVDGERARLSDFVDFQGIDPDEMMPARTECTLTWKVHEARRWIREHPASGGVSPVEVAWGFVRVEVLDDGTVSQEPWVVCTGRARRR